MGEEPTHPTIKGLLQFALIPYRLSPFSYECVYTYQLFLLYFYLQSKSNPVANFYFAQMVGSARYPTFGPARP